MAIQSENAIEKERSDRKIDDSAVICGGVPGDGEKNIVAADVDVKNIQREQQYDALKPLIEKVVKAQIELCNGLMTKANQYAKEGNATAAGRCLYKVKLPKYPSAFLPAPRRRVGRKALPPPRSHPSRSCNGKAPRGGGRSAASACGSKT